MTREHKLALIVGFSLILLVGVLISDHLSRARQAKIVPVGTGEAQIAETRPIDPLRNADGNAAMPATVQTPVTLVQETPPAPVTPQAEPAPITLGGNTPAPTPTPAGAETRQIREWTNPTPTTTASTLPQHDQLQRELAKTGSWIDGQGIIHLPTSADTTRPLPKPPTTTATTTTAAKPQPADSTKLYTVKKGDTLLKIAQATYGSGQLWQNLARYNGISENGLRLGATIKLPSRELLTGKPAVRPTETAAKPVPTPTTPSTTRSQPARLTPLPVKPAEVRYATYTVKPGDTLGHISQRVLGTSKRTQDILDLNRLDDEDSIPVGTVLKVPVKG